MKPGTPYRDLFPARFHRPRRTLAPVPVTATARKDVVRVRFPLPDTVETKYSNYDVVCFVRVVNGALEINYSYHVVRSRDSAVGPFSGESKNRMPLDAALRALVVTGVLCELWGHFCPTVRTLPSAMDTPLAQVDF